MRWMNLWYNRIQYNRNTSSIVWWKFHKIFPFLNNRRLLKQHKVLKDLSLQINFSLNRKYPFCCLVKRQMKQWTFVLFCVPEWNASVYTIPCVKYCPVFGSNFKTEKTLLDRVDTEKEPPLAVAFLHEVNYCL